MKPKLKWSMVRRYLRALVRSVVAYEKLIIAERDLSIAREQSPSGIDLEFRPGTPALGFHHHRPFQAKEGIRHFVMIMPGHALARRQGEHRHTQGGRLGDAFALFNLVTMLFGHGLGLGSGNDDRPRIGRPS